MLRSRMLSKMGMAVLLGALTLGCRHAADVTPNAPAAPGAPRSAAEDFREVVARVAKRHVHALQEGDYAPVETLEAASAARAPEGLTWSYPWGVTLYGMLRSTDATGDREVERFVLEHDRIASRYYAWLSALTGRVGQSPELAAFLRNVKIRSLINLGSLDSCGAMGSQLLEAMLRRPQQVTAEQRAAAERIADWVVNRQDRLPDGTLWRSRSMGGTIWIDDLYMGGVFLTRWFRFTGDRKYLDDAARQVINMAQRVQDADGVWFHGYFVSQNKPSPFKWGRGNGWAMLSTAEVLSAMPDDHPDRPRLLEILRRHIDGIRPLQAPSGMWRQVLDHPELWEETSCTAMFAYSIARAVNRRWIDRSYLAMARRAFAGIARNVAADGAIAETCRGTNIGTELEYYVQRERPLDDHHGPGPVLLAGTEVVLADRN